MDPLVESLFGVLTRSARRSVAGYPPHPLYVRVGMSRPKFYSLVGQRGRSFITVRGHILELVYCLKYI